MRKDEWVKAAMTDDRMVAELLMRFNNHHHQRFSPASPLAEKSLDIVFNNDKNNNNLLIKWCIRKARSRPIPVFRCNDNNHNTVVVHSRQAKREADLTWASPTTPLSWSPGTSLSGGTGSGGSGDFYEESSRPYINWSNSARSNKVTATTGTDIKRSRMRKTFVELKENDSFLLKEEIHMNKLTLQSQLGKEISSSCASNKASSNNDRLGNTQEYIDETPKIFRTSGNIYDPKSCEAEKVAVVSQKSFRVLPDLNVGLEDPGSIEVLYGWS